ncbi:MAG: DUF1569 domain-containing protein [Thermoanaerobaculia bacterium]
MKSLHRPEVIEETLQRIARVGTNSTRQWGTMTPEQMLAHLVQSMRMATGELPTVPKKTPLRFFPLKQIAIYVAPVPRSLPTAQELLPTESLEIDESNRELRRLLADFNSADRNRPLPRHPAFGRLGSHPWGVLMWRHLDHHLRQFGV